MTEPKAPAAWRCRILSWIGPPDFCETTPRGYYDTVEPLALHSDYLAEMARADKAEAFHDSMVEVKENWRREAHASASRSIAAEAQVADLLRQRDAASDEVAGLTARVEKAEASAEEGDRIIASLDREREEVQLRHDIAVGRAFAQVADLTAKLKEARGVLREVLDVLPYCPTCEAGGTLPHEAWCRLAAVIAPETGKELKE